MLAYFPSLNMSQGWHGAGTGWKASILRQPWRAPSTAFCRLHSKIRTSRQWRCLRMCMCDGFVGLASGFRSFVRSGIAGHAAPVTSVPPSEAAHEKARGWLRGYWRFIASPTEGDRMCGAMMAHLMQVNPAMTGAASLPNTWTAPRIIAVSYIPAACSHDQTLTIPQPVIYDSRREGAGTVSCSCAAGSAQAKCYTTR